MRRILLSLLFSTKVCCAAVSGTPQGGLEFPESGCSSSPELQDGTVACQFLGRFDDAPTYRLLYGRLGRPLIEFDRWINVLQDKQPHRIAVNSYEGSNYANCYVFWNAEKLTDGFSLDRAWAESASLSAEARKLRTTSDHTTYTCTKWSGDRLVVVARWEQTDGTYLVGTAKLASTGILSDVLYAVKEE